MKKLFIMSLSVLLALILAIVLISCGNTEDPSEVESTSSEELTQEQSVTEAQTDPPVTTDVVTTETSAHVSEEITTDTEAGTTAQTEAVTTEEASGGGGGGGGGGGSSGGGSGADTTEPADPCADGHTLGEWLFVEEKQNGEVKCEFVRIEKAECSKCEYVEEKTSDAFLAHTEKVTIENATCTLNGSKTFECAVCNALIDKLLIAANPNDDTLHSWEQTGEADGKVNYKCLECEGVKSVYVLENSENGVTISFENELEEGLTFVAELKADVLLDAEVPDDVKNAISNGKIYDLSMKNSEQETVEGAIAQDVTVKIAYELKANENPANLAVRYINAEGKVEAVDAIYDDGFVIFKTNHFSYYAVTFLTPGEMCEVYGHRFGNIKVPASCTTAAYEYRVCRRCGHVTEKVDTEAALGHTEVVVEAVAPTCTETGLTEGKYCSVCNAVIVEQTVVPALGHNYVGGECTMCHQSDPNCVLDGSKFENDNEATFSDAWAADEIDGSRFENDNEANYNDAWNKNESDGVIDAGRFANDNEAFYSSAWDIVKKK